MLRKYSNYFIILGCILTIIFIGGSTFTDSFGVTNTNSIQSTTGKSLDVKISPSPSQVLNTTEVKFKVDFLEPNTNKIQVHIDYDFQILNNGEELFSAAKQISQPLLHTAEGSVTIPYTFSSPGVYSINIPVLGINFIPINPESVKFDFTIT